ncbi:hypothetical protein BABINDRAFT_33756 [Babjeviella inositovora NRRL Y-12698]|uniref:Signal peptidase complex subunit 1 n=1 Tax=Babjeviella inositovora NRRL Y-12698 TaxID=984486 RepID=A0A1E3QUL3_9ASCO|nr:uncharacterized protein BABINDRAFT_33756 [Babjeviella inositovora NRRL Y-12698]ODQ81375.1 hypothetical protein BABINDRAFT_33756 [Babjeviella inositovora NRRL Y-12698]
MDALPDLIEFPIDFVGQRKANRLTNLLLFSGAALSVLVGFVSQSFINTIYAFAGVFVLTLVAIVPAWPYFNKNPVVWLKPKKIEILL